MAASKSCTQILKNLHCEKPRKTLKNSDHEKRGKQLNAEKRLEDHIRQYNLLTLKIC